MGCLVDKAEHKLIPHMVELLKTMMLPQRRCVIMIQLEKIRLPDMMELPRTKKLPHAKRLPYTMRLPHKKLRPRE